MNTRLVFKGLKVLAHTLQGGRAQRLSVRGVRSDKLGGPRRLGTLFQPASADDKVAADFRERHEEKLRAEVLGAVLRTIERFEDGSIDGDDQAHFDDLYIALAHLHLLMRDRKGELHKLTLVEQLISEHCQALQSAYAEAWLMPRIAAELNAPDSSPA